MNQLTQQTKQIAELLPKISKNLQIVPLLNEVKPGLTTSQLIILLILRDMKNAALPVGKLAQELAISFPAVSGIIDRLYRDKLIERSHSTQDRRIVLVKLSDTGKDIIEKLLHSFETIIFDILKKIPEMDRQSIINATQRVLTFSSALTKNDLDGTIPSSNTSTP